jgi:hypothetical protein
VPTINIPPGYFPEFVAILSYSGQKVKEKYIIKSNMIKF